MRWIIRIGMLLVTIVVIVGFAGYMLYRFWYSVDGESNNVIRDYLVNLDSRPPLMNTGRGCNGAPFILPSSGLIGLLYADPARPYNALRRHTGIDIFGNGAPGTIPIYSAYDGYLTRLDAWLSTVIIRHVDPLVAGRTIWTYYTHMASRDGETSFVSSQFPRGTAGVFIPQGTLLGYQGEFAGDGAAIAMHLHFSIVLSDENAAFLNEAVLDNTLDPSPYFGMPLNVNDNPARPIQCR
jgi:peptidoglycan LD-endopeptidase LytH